jgi:hypothetical protein
MNRIRTAGTILALSISAGGCGVVDGKLLGGSVPRHGSLIPNTRVQLTPGYATTVEKLTLTAAAAAALYYVYEPLDPNWEGADLPVSNEIYRISLRMKRFHTGGDGEALQVARRYAEQLQVARGASGYTIVEFAQGIESSTPIARRIAEAIVRLKDVPAPLPEEIEGPPRALADAAPAMAVAAR